MSAVNKRNPLLDAYLRNLVANPLWTKAATAATLQFSQDALASAIAGARPRPGKAAPLHEKALAKVSADMVSVKMAVAGALVFAPLNHALGIFLARLLATRGKTGTRAKVEGILANNLIAAPINTVAYLASIAIINGARSVDGVLALVQRGFFGMLKMTWMISPVAMVIAQKAIPPELWPLFFNFVGFVIGTYMSARVKKARLAAARAKKDPKDPKAFDV
ncbi:hypothetical protein EXIGLDRAFT_601777 [Exidia glandulosa HHB12029]|uniref:Integral membrane protein n=1 Tax=Exidia glandulosa HHB12029 TaxID=1314781 RepID=A0A165PR77_EXIGL|nr:hypothetical protein EXIGLDRAFT_601777 [Exidia glandulosa HHB12029]